MSKRLVIADMYSRFKYKKQNDLVEILKSTKDLVVNSRKYRSYSRDYNMTTHINSFKRPEIETYPIIRNTELIPLNRTLFDYSPEKAKNNKKTPKPFNHLLITNPQIISLKHKRKIETTKEEVEPEERHCLTSREQKSKKFIHDKIYLLRNIMFNDAKYEYLMYDERFIFNKQNVYEDYIRSCIDRMTVHKVDNEETSYEKYYKNGNQFNDAILSLSSIVIEFKNITAQNKKPIQIKIPFSFIPLFYYNSFANIKYILVSCLHFANDFESIVFKADELYHLVKTSNEFNTDSTNYISTKQSNDCITDNGEYSTNKIIEEARKTIRINPHNPIEPNKYWKYFNTFSYNWVTPKYVYKVDIKLPEISVKLYKKVITKYIGAELLMYLLMNEFTNWDFYVIHYMFSFKLFRYIIVKALSKYSKGTLLDNEDNKYVSNRIHDVEYISLSRTKSKEMSMKLNYYEFLFTEKNYVNYVNTLHSYSVNVYNESLRKNVEYVFEINLEQMKKMNHIAKTEKLTHFINKILITNLTTKTIELNYSVFEHIKITPQKRTRPTISIKIPTCSSQSELAISSTAPNVNYPKNEFIITIDNPYLESLQYLSKEGGKLNLRGNCLLSDTNDCAHHFIKPEVIDKLTERPLIEWGRILYESKQEIEDMWMCPLQKVKTTKSKKSGVSIFNKNSLKRGTVDRNMFMGIIGRPKNSCKVLPQYIKKNTLLLKHRTFIHN